MSTTKQITSDIIAQIESETGQKVPTLKRAWIRVIAKVFAGLFTILYKYSNWMTLQQFVQTADFKETSILGEGIRPLVFWGRLIGVGEPTQATAAELDLTIDVLDQGGVLASGTQLVYAPTGVTYITLVSTPLDALTVIARVRAVSDQAGTGGLGTQGNAPAGSNLSFANAPAAVAQNATVAAQVTTAADAESETAYRQRVLDRFQKRPEGGAYADYEAWAEEVPGIVGAYPYTGAPGQVDVYVEATQASSGSADGVPTNAQLLAVLDSINYDESGRATRRNASAWPNIYPIRRTGFDATVVGVTGVDDPGGVQENIRAALREFFLSVSPYIQGLSVPPRSDQITRTRVSSIVEDIVTAAGGTFTSAAFSLEGTPAFVESYVLSEGEKAKLLTVSFV